MRVCQLAALMALGLCAATAEAQRTSVQRLWGRRDRWQPVRQGVPPATARPRLSPWIDPTRLMQLSRDPAHGGASTAGALQEARVGLTLETLGLLRGPIRREASGASEFVDGLGVRWDVKAFNSLWPPEAGGFSLEHAVRKLEREFRGGERVILDGTSLSAEHKALLKQAIARRGWAGNVLWYEPPPQRPTTN